MKVLLAHPPRPLVEELARRGRDLVVAGYPGQFPPDSLPGGNCRFVPFPHRPKLDPRAIRAMRHILREHEPDLVHAFSARSLAAAVLAGVGLRPRPDIMSFRGISSPPSQWDPVEHITYLSPRVTRHACESEAVAAGLVRAGVPRNACHVVYNCVDAAALQTHDRDAIRDRFGIPREAFVIGSIATIRPVKGIDILLRAALECLDLDDLHLLIVGRVRDTAVRRLARDPRWRGRLRLTGFVPTAGGLANGFDLFVMPSRYEALCRALLEAMAVGTCPVVSDAGGMKEVVRHGQDGVVFPRGDAAALAVAIRRLHADRGLIRRHGQAARLRVQAMCSPGAMADRIEDGYRSWAAQSSGQRRRPGHVAA